LEGKTGYIGGLTSKRETVALRTEPREIDCPGRPCAEEITDAEISESELVRYVPRTST